MWVPDVVRELPKEVSRVNACTTVPMCARAPQPFAPAMINPDCPYSSGDTGASQCGKADPQGNKQQQQQDYCITYAGQGQWASMVAGHVNGDCGPIPVVKEHGHAPAHGQESMRDSGSALVQLPGIVQGQQEGQQEV